MILASFLFFISLFAWGWGNELKSDSATAIKQEVAALHKRQQQLKAVYCRIYKELALVDKALYKENLNRALLEGSSNAQKRLRTLLLWVGGEILKYFFGVNNKALLFVQEVDAPCLYALINDLASQMEIPPPMTFIHDDGSFINAAAFSFSHGVSMMVVCRTAIEAFSYNELVATIVHELGHIKRHHMMKRTGAWFLLSAGLTTAGYGVWSQFSNARLLPLSCITVGSGLASLWVLSPYYVAQEVEADKIALQITHDQASIDSSLAVLRDLERYYNEIHQQEKDLSWDEHIRLWILTYLKTHPD